MNTSHIRRSRRVGLFDDIRVPARIPVINIPVSVSANDARSTEPVREDLTELDDEMKVDLLKYNDINHTDSRLYIHVWSQERAMAVTDHDVMLNDTDDYMVMIMRFPFSSKGQYFATATSFIDAGMSDLEYVESYDRLVELDLN